MTNKILYFKTVTRWTTLVLWFSSLILVSCSEEKPPQISKKKPPKKIITPPVFSPDSAYKFVQKQVDFGPRTPNSQAHETCANYLTQKLKNYGAKVIVQEGTVTGYDGTNLGMKNIIGQYSPEKNKRILLCAHWDTRPWADKDSLEANWHTPIDGANDGASGVAVLLEVARVIQKKEPNYGVDIIFFDDEDYGTPNFSNIDGGQEAWCLGSQYWAKHPHVPGYQARFGILLDMVGAKGAEFPKEGTSLYFASNVVRQVWKNARKVGHSDYFINTEIGQTIDDHFFINQINGTPTIDIVHYDVGHGFNDPGGYGHYHHTLKDNMSTVSKKTLKSVGETVLYTIYNP